MAKLFEKHVVLIILTLVSVSIGWLMTSPSDAVSAEEYIPPTPRDMLITETIVPTVVDADDGITLTPIITITAELDSTVELDSTAIASPTLTITDATSTIMSTSTPIVIAEGGATIPPSTTAGRDTRAPWAWSPRIGGGSRIGVRDVGGYVYISTPSWRCNGALIDPEWVMTNAGCVTGNRTTGSPISTASIKVVTGCYGVVDCVKMRNSLWYGTQSQVVGVSRVLIYQPTPKVTDVDMTVALLKLSSPVITGTGVNVVPLGVSSDIVVNQRGLTVMSYGDIPPNKGPTSLQRAVYSIASDSTCSGLKGYRDGMHHCGGTVPQVCKADWGAPIMRSSNGQSVLYGILASQTALYGTGCPQNKRSVAIDVTSDEIREWIATTVRQGRTGVIADQDGLGGLGSALARGNNRQHVIDISGVFPQGIRIGGVTSKKLSINENGVIALGSMTSGIPSYIDIAKWSGGKAPVIVVFGADGDTSGMSQRGVIGGTSNGSNQVWMTQDVSRRVVVITWDDIRPMSTSVTGARAIGNSYQVELRAQENGDVKVTMRYGVIGWTAGATQCGKTCSGKYAQVGIADGRGKFQLGVPVVATSDVGLRKLTGKQLTFYLRDGVINKVNQVPPVRPTWTASPTRTLTSSPTSTPIGQGLTDGLLAWYPLNGIRTTGSALPAQANTIMGAAQSFDGVNDYHQTTVDLANKSFTVAFWASFTHTPGKNHMVVSAGRNASNYQALQIYVTPNHVVCDFYSNGLVYTFDTNTFDYTQWHHYACTYDRSSTRRQIVVDGVVVATDTPPQALAVTSEFTIGKPPWNTDYLQGILRDVIIYNRALSITDINRIKDLTPNSVMLSEPHPASDCRWVDKGGMVHEYEINQDLLTWDQAKAEAELRSRGGQKGYLATITSAAEGTCLGQLVLATSGNYDSWVGGERPTSGAPFIWSGGPEKGMMIGTSSSAIGYENWMAGEPNNPIEDGLLFYTNSTSNDVESRYASRSIIEYTYPETRAINGVAYTDVNNNNQLDVRDTRAANQQITLVADIAKPIDIVGGGNQFCARLDDGQVTCWGRRGDTWRWDQQSAVPIEVDAWRDVRAISNGIHTSCALLANGTVSCLGNNSTGAVGDGTTSDRWTPVTVSGLSNVIALNSGGGYHHCAVLSNNTVKCWGDNTYAQLGDGTYTRRTTPVAVNGLSGVVQVAVGERYSCARKGDGTVWCWGSNDSGQLASSGIAESRTPRQVAGVSGIKQLAAGWQHVCVIRSDNQVSCWGHPGGINGNRSGTSITTPTVIANTTNSVSLSLGFEQSCVAKSDGTVWCWGHVFHGEAGWVSTAPGNSTVVRRSSAVQLTSLSNIVQVTLSANSGCGRRANGDMLCWGEANMGQLGDGTYQPRGIAREVRVTWQTNPYAARVAMLDASYLYQCGILTDRRVACWGLEGFYRPTNTYIKPEPEIIDGLRDVVDIHVSTNFTCALQRNSLVWCWGYDLPTWIMDSGTVSGSTIERGTPRRITTITNAIALAKGNGIYCLAITADGYTYCYEDTGPLRWTNAFKMVPNSTFTNTGMLTPSYIHNCALKQDGTVWCWGDNSYFAQYGNGVANTINNVPVQVGGLSTIQQLSVASYSNCVLQSAGSVQCWGKAEEIGIDGSGQVNAGQGKSYGTPQTISGITNAKKIDIADKKQCAVLQDGTVWCWGNVLYEGERSASITPYQISGVSDVIDISVGAGSVCVLRRGGEVLCWGAGDGGGLGNGQTTNRTIPRPISEPWQANMHQGCEWVDWQGQRHSYESLSGDWTWTQARDMAASRTWRGAIGYLATITSPEENRCVHQLYMKSASNEQYPGLTLGSWPRRWLGGSDADSEGTWKWMTGPEAGTTFRNPTGLNPGYNAFQTVSDACKPNCNYNLTWDYLSMLYLRGTQLQHNQWNDEIGTITQGALVEYTTASGEVARTYTTTTDNQGSYTFAGLAPGVYTLQRTVNGNINTERIVIRQDQVDITANLRASAFTPTPTRTVTRTMAPLKQISAPTMTPTPRR